MIALATSAPARGLTIGVFAAVLAITLGVTFWAARRIRSATDFWSAGRGISGAQNGIAIAGEFLSAAAFLGVAGLMFLSGFDGYLTGIAALLSFVPLLLLLAERMRNAGRYTMADVVGLRMPAGRIRVASAISTMCIAALYVVAQSVAAGSLFEALVGIPYWISVIVTGVAMLTYVVLGGMLATTWVQIIKATLLLIGVATMARQEIRAGRIAVIAIGIVGIALAEAAGKTFNVQLLTGLIFAVAASANFPPLLLALTWRRFNTLGAMVGIASGLISSIVLIILSPQVWSGPASAAPFPLGNPAIVSIPIGFLGCIIGTLLGGREQIALDSFEQIRVRTATGIGAEEGSAGTGSSDADDSATPSRERDRARGRQPAGVR